MKQGARWWRRDERGAGPRRPGDEPARAAGDPLTLASERRTPTDRSPGADAARMDADGLIANRRCATDGWMTTTCGSFDGGSMAARRWLDDRLTAV